MIAESIALTVSFIYLHCAFSGTEPQTVPMAAMYQVKNTFVELDSDATQTTCEGSAHRRSSSVPRAFKPASCLVSVMAAVIADDSCTHSRHSDDSTNASEQDAASTCEEQSPISDACSQSGSAIFEDCMSDHETAQSTTSGDNSGKESSMRLELWSNMSTTSGGNSVKAGSMKFGLWSNMSDNYDMSDDFAATSIVSDNCSEKACLVDYEKAESVSSDDYSTTDKMTLNLADMVTASRPPKQAISLESLCTSRSKLRSGARLFRSARDPPEELNALISCVAEAFRNGQDIMDVQVQNGGMGGTTMIVARTCSPMPDATLIFPFVKDAALTAAAQSERTYIMGYNVRPFNDLNSLSFSMNVASVPVAHANTACWETYENGICPRHSCCRWEHPAELDMMRVIIVLEKMEW